MHILNIDSRLYELHLSNIRTRFDEHRRLSPTSSEVSQHTHHTAPGHSIDFDESNILTVEPKWVKEAIAIRQRRPTLNRDGGRYELPPVWGNLLAARSSGRGGRPSSGPRNGSHAFGNQVLSGEVTQ